MNAQITLFDLPPVVADVRDCWRTPRELWALLSQRWRFSCDVCCDDGNCLVPDGVRLADALAECWPSGELGWCFCNPPFSRLPEFSSRICEMVDIGARVIALFPAHRCEQEWWHKYVLGRAAWLLYPAGRVDYVAPHGVAGDGARFPSVVAQYWRGTKHRTCAEAL